MNDPDFCKFFHSFFLCPVDNLKLKKKISFSFFEKTMNFMIEMDGWMVRLIDGHCQNQNHFNFF